MCAGFFHAGFLDALHEGLAKTGPRTDTFGAGSRKQRKLGWECDQNDEGKTAEEAGRLKERKCKRCRSAWGLRQSRARVRSQEGTAGRPPSAHARMLCSGASAPWGVAWPKGRWGP
jgi:hypothetical protein